MTTEEVMKKAVRLGACEKSGKATDFKSLCWLFFSPQGREFCINNRFPSMETFRAIREGVRPYGVHIEENVEIENENSALIGCNGDLTFSGVERTYKVILMHGAYAVIRLKNYAVVLIESADSNYMIINDGTGVVL